EEFHQFARPFHGSGTRQTIHSAYKFKKLDAGKSVKEEGFVGDEADSFLNLQFVLGEFETQDLNGPAIAGNQPGEHTDSGRFPGAVGPKKTEKRSARNFEIDAIDGGFEPVRFSKIADQDGGRHAYSLRCLGMAGCQPAEGWPPAPPG